MLRNRVRRGSKKAWTCSKAVTNKHVLSCVHIKARLTEEKIFLTRAANKARMHIFFCPKKECFWKALSARTDMCVVWFAFFIHYHWWQIGHFFRQERFSPLLVKSQGQLEFTYAMLVWADILRPAVVSRKERKQARDPMCSLEWVVTVHHFLAQSCLPACLPSCRLEKKNWRHLRTGRQCRCDVSLGRNELLSLSIHTRVLGGTFPEKIYFWS